ncbi:murein transglycosylase A [Advenella sp. WQ 585]|uniref:peptidoglycan lytic exotransglycosylase n=1 Tax=Advenella mandrilli TaxID=2800330 RepID=A0ABS1EG75_9BURK|nr:MltA domain-containing protein [Advenella mandrilli]MBK1781887.1 murein transglycosylase A [Advenella mandrilli]
MKLRLLALSAGSAVLLAACSGSAPYVPGESPETVAIDAPLTVPALSSFAQTAERKLSGQYTRVSWSDLPGWDQEQVDNLWLTLVNNCRGLMRPISGSLTIPARATPQAWQPVCKAVAESGQPVRSNNAAFVKNFLETHLQPWKVSGVNGSSNTVTGYYEPVVRGSLSQGGQYQWPMYAPPADLLTIDLGGVYPELAGKRIRGKLVDNKVVPYDTREQINASANKPPVIAWLDDPVEAFFLQIQGSGRVLLDNGETLRLAYADHNGRPYTSIGKWLADKGEIAISQASMQNIKAWAKANPGRVNEMLNANQAMVFFRPEKVTDEAIGPKGAYGIPLIAQRSVAVDPVFVPLGSPLFLSTTQPGSNTPLRNVVFAQDTGAAIKGAARTDFFWGSGPEAGNLAGKMKQQGEVWILWPKQAGAPSAR